MVRLARPAPLVRLAAASLLLAAGPRPGALAGESAPKDPLAAMAAARPLLEAAKKAKPSDTTKEGKEIAQGIRDAYALLKGQQKDGLQQPEFRAVWNEMITLGHFHGLKALPPEYQMEKGSVDRQPIRFSLPVGRGWEYRKSGTTDQLWGAISKTLPGGRVVRQIRIWIYDWFTTYSGIGGENDKGLAEEGLKADRSTAVKITFRSNEVVKGRLGRGMPKAYYYEVVGEDRELGPLRRRNYYVKGTEKTFCFEVLELRQVGVADDPWTEYQTTANPDRELEAILETFEDTGKK